MKKYLSILILLLIPSLAEASYPINWGWDSVGGGWGCVDRRTSTFPGAHHVIDTTSGTPDPTGALKIIYPVGWYQGGEPTHCWNTFGSAKEEIYVQYYFKYSSGYLFHGTDNKQTYFWLGAGTSKDSANWYLTVNGSHRVNLVTQTYATNRFFPNTSYNPYIEDGRWYKMTARFVMNTAGTLNGIAQVWIDDKLVMSHSTVGYRSSAQAGHGAIEMTITPVFGGTSALVKSVEDYQWYDKTVVQTTPIDNTEDTASPYIDTRSPASGATGVPVTNRTVSFHVKDAGLGVSSGSIVATIEGTAYTCASGLTCTGAAADVTVTRTMASDWSQNQVVNVSVVASDIIGNAMPANAWIFTTEYGDTGSTKTKAELLAFIQGLPSQTTKKILSGQRIGFIDGSSEDQGTKLFDDIAASTGGVLPAIMAADISMKDQSTGSYDLAPLIAHWNAGGLVHFVWHSANPANNNVYVWPLNSPTVTLSNVYTPGNTTYDNFRIQLVKVGDAFEALQDNGVVVMFAPFHEAQNYSTFWWANKPADQYIAMWRYVHNYLVTERGLSNIIFVYATQGNTTSPSPATSYPGDAYVDIVGADYYSYTGRYNASALTTNYAVLQGINKPFANTEAGICPSTASCGGIDARVFLNDVLTYTPNSVFFYLWDDADPPYYFDTASLTYEREMLQDPRVITLQDNPSGAVAYGGVTIVDNTLPNGTVGTSYSHTLTAINGVSPYTWSLSSGTMPTGLSLPPSGAGSWGTPTASGTYSFTIGVSDSSAGSAYTDDFNRSNETPLAGNWTQDTGDNVALVDNALRTAAPQWDQTVWRNSETYHANHYSKVRNATAAWSSEIGGPTVRNKMNGSVWNGYEATILSTSTIAVWVAYGTSPTWEQVGSTISGLSLAQNDNILLSITGNVLTVKVNGSTVGTLTDQYNRVPSGGAPGVMVYGTTARWDDWEGWDVNPLTASDTQALSMTVLPDTPGGTVVVGGTMDGDTFINSGSDGDDNYSTGETTEVYVYPMGTAANIILDNIVLGLPADAVITRVAIRKYLTGWEGSGGTNPMRIHVRRYSGLTAPLSAVTWDSFDGTYEAAESVTEVPLTVGWYEFVCTNAAQWAHANSSNLFVALDPMSDGAQDTNRIFASAEYTDASLRPQIVITYYRTLGGTPIRGPGSGVFRSSTFRSFH